MPAARVGIDIGGKTSSTSQPGTADSNKLRRWTDGGVGTLGGMQHLVNRLFRTEEEAFRTLPRIDGVSDVTKGLGMDDEDRHKIERIIEETRADYGMSEKLRYPRKAFAMTALSEFLQKTKRISPEARMQVRRRAMEFWRKFGKTTYEAKPRIRHVVNKAQLLVPDLMKADAQPATHGGPFIGPKGGKWANPEHTIAYTDISKYKLRVNGSDHAKTAKKLEEGIGKAADICKITPPVCKDNLGIDRKEMPQLPTEVIPGFLQKFQAGGVDVTKDTMKVGELKATQKEINADKVQGMAKAYREGSYDPSKQPIIVSKDGYVLDGHHRWAAMLHDHPENEMRVYRVDTDIKTLLKAAQSHEGVNYGQGFGAGSDIKENKKVGDTEDIKEHEEAVKKAHPPMETLGKRKTDEDDDNGEAEAKAKGKVEGKAKAKGNNDDGWKDGAPFDPASFAKEHGKDVGNGKKPKSNGMELEPHESGTGHRAHFHEDVSADLRGDADFDHHATEWSKHTAGYHVNKDDDPEKAEAHRQAANLHARIGNALHVAGRTNGPQAPGLNGGGGPLATYDGKPQRGAQGRQNGAFPGIKEESPGKDVTGQPIPAKPDKMRNVPVRDSETEGQRKLYGGKDTKLQLHLTKAGPYIGPQGGKWADPSHTIPWKEPSKDKPAKPSKISPRDMNVLKAAFRFGRVIGGGSHATYAQARRLHAKGLLTPHGVLTEAGKKMMEESKPVIAKSHVMKKRQSYFYSW